MKTKATNKAKPKRKNEFRYHDLLIKTKTGKKKKIKHPSYVWQERGNVYDYHSITHSSDIEGVELIKLRKNPNPSDKRDSYYDSKSKSDIKSSFGRNNNSIKRDINWRTCVQLLP